MRSKGRGARVHASGVVNRLLAAGTHAAGMLTQKTADKEERNEGRLDRQELARFEPSQDTMAVRPRSCLLSQQSRVRMRVRTCLPWLHLAAACCGADLRQLQPDSASRREVQVFRPDF